jgi:stage IV sporulation protein FB
MSLFQPPPITRYDLRFTLFGIPVRVHPLFWLMVVVFGLSSANLTALLIWIVVVFLSILAHELGHAFAMGLYGQDSSIVLHMAGGLTVPGRWSNVSLGRYEEIFISFAGPLAGFILAGLVMLGVVALGGSISVAPVFGIIPLPVARMPLWGSVAVLIVRTFLWVNVFWGLINLVPVIPLDGGNITRNVLLIVDPVNGVRTSLWVSVVAGGLAAILGLLFLGSLYIALLFGYLAFRSYQTLRGRVGRTY